jgi:hypothetical protein
MAAQTLSQAHQPNRFLDLYRHLVDLAIASVEMAVGDWRALPVDRPPPTTARQ